MVKMETYLKISGRIGGIKVKDCTKKDKKFFDEEDFIYIWGGINLQVDDVYVVTKDNYDEIASLWIFLSEDIRCSKFLTEKVSVTFPEGHQRVEFTPVGVDKVKISYHSDRKNRSAIADKKELLEEFAREGISFFNKMKVLKPSDALDCEAHVMFLETMIRLFRKSLKS